MPSTPQHQPQALRQVCAATVETVEGMALGFDCSQYCALLYPPNHMHSTPRMQGPRTIDGHLAASCSPPETEQGHANANL